MPNSNYYRQILNIFFLFKKEDDITDSLLENDDTEEKKIIEKEKHKTEYDEFL